MIPGPLRTSIRRCPPLAGRHRRRGHHREEHKTDRLVRFTVASPALRRAVGVEVLLPKDNSVPRPSIYALEA
ncbi:hypothetical protein GS416_02800 [Rhodococcus hoagii]|nr:hypothetical protein [Prescottella equi]